MAARTTLSSAERRQLHRNIATLRGDGWTLRQIAAQLGLSVSALSNMLRSKDRGTSRERAAKLEKLLASNATPPSRARRGTSTGRRARTAPGRPAAKSGRGARGRKRPSADGSGDRASLQGASRQGAPLVASATVHAERVLPVPAISGLADVERRKRFVEQLDDARAHLSRAHESLQATIESGSATVVTQPGDQRILDMLQHLRDELAAT
jgi:transcriptional regulator with XRE-family HTH domain